MNEPIENFNYDRFPKTEKIDGRIYFMAAPCDEHIDVQGNLNYIFTDYFIRNKKNCRARHDAKTDIDEDTYFKPDLKILCKDFKDGLIPVIVIEILSRSTRERDLTVKMEKYAKLGIKEYWVITWELSLIDIYLLEETETEQKYNLYKSYSIYGPEEIKLLDEYEKKEVVTEFSPRVFPGLTIKLEDVFNIFK